MSVGPPVQPGQLSPDGMWRWNGSQWVPAMAVAPHRSKTWIWWLVGALALSLVLILVGAGYGIYQVASKFQSGGFSCLPSDFPAYPGAQVLTENTYLGSGLPPGDTKQCRMILDSTDPVTSVGPYYQSHLGSGDWTVTTTDFSSGTIHFRRASRPQTIGTVELLQHGQQTEIRIALAS